MGTLEDSSPDGAVRSMGRLAEDASGALAVSLAHAFFDNHPHAVLILDAQGRVLRGNAAAAWLAVDGSFPDFAQLTGLDIPRDAFATRDRGPLWSRRLRVRTADGSSRQVDASLVVAEAAAGEGCFFILRDASPAVEAARVLHQAESRSRVTTESAPVLVWMAGPDMRCDWFNSSWLKFRGRTLGDEVGDGWTEGVHPEDLERCLGVHEASFEAREAFTLDYRLKRHDGLYRWMLDTGVPRHGASGEFLGYIGTCLDITDRRELEDKLAEHTRVLRLADRRREDFLARLSHELRNPLAPIANAAALLRHMEPDRPELARIRAIIERQVDHLRRLITDLVDVTRVTKGKIVLQREEVDVQTLIAMAIDRVKADADSRHQVFEGTDEHHRGVACIGDPHRLAQALAALLSNAIKFSSEGATIGVAVDASDDMVTLRVRDRGRGIAPDFLPRVFDLYLQGEPQFARDAGGLGVGLTIAQRIAQLHGGEVTIDSSGIGLGTEASLTLRRSDGTAGANAPSGIDAGGPDDLRDVHGKRVLVIEDNDDSRESLRLLLELGGNEVRTAATSIEGLRVAERFMPQLVVCDIGLPDGDGCELVASLRDRLAGQPTRYVALTGFGRSEDRDRALDSGFDSFLVKPLAPPPVRQ